MKIKRISEQLEKKNEHEKASDERLFTTITVSIPLWRLINENRLNPKEPLENVVWRWYNLLKELKGDDF